MIYGTIDFDGFDWDSGNTAKSQKHGVSIEEIEDFFSRKVLLTDDQRHSEKEKRFIAIGQTKKNKVAFIAFVLRRNLIRVISARYMHKKERRVYESIKNRLTEEN